MFPSEGKGIRGVRTNENGDKARVFFGEKDRLARVSKLGNTDDRKGFHDAIDAII